MQKPNPFTAEESARIRSERVSRQMAKSSKTESIILWIVFIIIVVALIVFYMFMR
ncbi:hypothetical protein KDA_62590 [Dictyobacter alpinus]|uniref:Uncharacterized protein n=1 Tax=Dictyobacter alpinus TaxID=2014873 RepID=A0A402BHD1_9CHLR|nr:hypothetical protein KDA_62590 [Dictyobacter alpinus]